MSQNRVLRLQTSDGERQYLKILTHNEKAIHQHFKSARIDTSHFVPPLRMWEHDEETLALFSDAGDCMSDMDTEGSDIDILTQLLAAISELHDHDIAHMDIKPENILWNAQEGLLKIIDFDSSIFFDPDTTIQGPSGHQDI